MEHIAVGQTRARRYDQFLVGRRGGRAVLHLFRDGKCLVTVGRTYRRLFKAAWKHDDPPVLSREEIHDAVFRRVPRPLTASQRVTLSRALRRLEELNILTRESGGSVRFTRDGWLFAGYVVDKKPPKPWPGERELTWAE